MTIYILVIADTHSSSLSQLPDRLGELVREADWVVHCGDFTELKCIVDLRRLSKNFVGVYGNSDTPEVRALLSSVEFFEVAGKKFVVTHPHFGGSPWGLEDELAAQYRNVDAILFGHTHDTCCKFKNGVLLLNPGQGYPTFIHELNVGVVKVTEKGVEGRVFPLGQAVWF